MDTARTSFGTCRNFILILSLETFVRHDADWIENSKNEIFNKRVRKKRDFKNKISQHVYRRRFRSFGKVSHFSLTQFIQPLS